MCEFLLGLVGDWGLSVIQLFGDLVVYWFGNSDERRR